MKPANKGMLYADGAPIACVTAWDVAWSEDEVRFEGCPCWATGNLALICEADTAELLRKGAFFLRIAPFGEVTGETLIEGDVSLNSVSVSQSVDVAVAAQAAFGGRLRVLHVGLAPELEVVAGTPGWFVTHDGEIPFDLAALRAFGLDQGPTVWLAGQYVVLGDGSNAYWSGSAWEEGTAP